MRQLPIVFISKQVVTKMRCMFFILYIQRYW